VDASDQALAGSIEATAQARLERLRLEIAFKEKQDWLMLTVELAGCQGRNSQLADHGRVKPTSRKLLAMSRLLVF
jgi:hypothetical protein